MAKNKILTEHGIREFYAAKGCHSCMDCKYLKMEHETTGREVYTCTVNPNRKNLFDRRFPYDNTKCKHYEEKQ